MRLISLILVFTCVAIALSYCNLSKSKETAQPIPKDKLAFQDSIVDQYLKNGAWKHETYSQAYQDEIDKGLAIDSTIAYLWQQKAMPLFKQGKYDIAMDYINKAVEYAPSKYQEYRAFMKCIFAKTYREAIIDLEDCKSKYGDQYVMDHSYSFYIGLSQLQLNEFEQAELTFSELLDSAITVNDKNYMHHLDLFYYGIAKYELDKFQEAHDLFDLALQSYSKFSDAQVYKADCLRKLGKVREADVLLKEAEINGRAGYTINEDNAIYERYPYQIRWF